MHLWRELFAHGITFLQDELKGMIDQNRLQVFDLRFVHMLYHINLLAQLLLKFFFIRLRDQHVLAYAEFSRLEPTCHSQDILRQIWCIIASISWILNCHWFPWFVFSAHINLMIWNFHTVHSVSQQTFFIRWRHAETAYLSGLYPVVEGSQRSVFWLHFHTFYRFLRTLRALLHSALIRVWGIFVSGLLLNRLL